MLLIKRYIIQRTIYHAKAEGREKARLHGVNHGRITGCQEESSALKYTTQSLQ